MATHSEKQIANSNQRPPEEVESTSSTGASLVHQRTEMSYSGPLPPPNVLEGFEKILPGAAERIFVMAEKQLEHRMSLEKTVIEGGSKRADKGIYAAVIIEAMFLATSCYLAHLGMTADALKVVGGSAVGLLAAFGFGTLSRRNERIKKKQIQAEVSDSSL
jgi:uncharacterized membrane protein